MRHEKTVSVSKIKPLWEPWEEDETPRKTILFVYDRQHGIQTPDKGLFFRIQGSPHLPNVH